MPACAFPWTARLCGSCARPAATCRSTWPSAATTRLLDICRTPEIAAEVTITAAERLGVDAAIIFADLLLPFTPMGLDFEFVADEGPGCIAPIRTAEQVRALRTDRTDELLYVSRAIEKVAAHFAAPRADGDQLGIIGFCGAPFTLASYMIEGGSSRNYVETKKMMYGDGAAWGILMEKLVTVLSEYAAQQVEAGADCHPGLRLLGGRALRRGLPPVRPGPDHRTHPAHPRPWRPCDLLRRGHRVAAARDARDGRGCSGTRLARPARSGLAHVRILHVQCREI